MSNIFDYIEWRGDLSVEKDEFNDVDALILSRLSYIPFDGIVSEMFSVPITVREAAEKFLSLKDAEDRVLMPDDMKFIRLIKESPRFNSMELFGFINQLDFEAVKQFCALCIKISENTIFVSYRGTDNTLIGWKEDFYMSFSGLIPSQKTAVSYLEKAAEERNECFIVGGHSKGGNLAVYASAYVSPEIQNRIISVYNNDGPGFAENIIASPGFKAILGRLNTYIPQSSIVGMMLEHEENYTIIHSTQTGMMQHDIYSWEVIGKEFIYLDKITNTGIAIDRTLKEWVSDMDPAQMEKFVDVLFEILDKTNAKTLKELSEKWYNNAVVILKSWKGLDDSVRKLMMRTLLSFLKCAKHNVSLLIKRNR